MVNIAQKKATGVSVPEHKALVVAVPVPEFAIRGGEALPPPSSLPFAVNQRQRAGKERHRV